MRNLDITTLRSFLAVADYGGVTRAAGFLNLTQSAVSMQLKRLEELFGIDLLDRSGRTIALTAQGEQLVTYARRMVALNDEVVHRLTDKEFEGEITLGVPHDIVYPAIPRVLKQFNAAYPRVRVSLVSSYTKELRDNFAKGTCDIILTTETAARTGGEILCKRPLCWVGAPGGAAWRKRPLPLAFGRRCSFRPQVIDCLDAAGVDWTISVETENDRTIEATVSADLALHAMIDGTEPAYFEQIASGGALPPLPAQYVILYAATQQGNPFADSLREMLRKAFAVQEPAFARAV